MQLTSVITPFSDENLALVAQVGVEGIAIRYPGKEIEDLLAIKQRVESFGLTITAVEGYVPIENIILGNQEAAREIEEMKLLVRNMQTANIPVLCYNFMAGTDWVRTKLDVAERGGALVTQFNLAEAEAASSPHYEAPSNIQPIHADQIWKNLEQFLNELVPVAESCGVKLAMHPDDPPLDSFWGRDRIMNSVESFERLVDLVPSPANAICFCQGSFAEMGVDIPDTIRRLGKHIAYVHCRDIRGTRENFAETFHDNGPTNMVEAFKAYREIGFTGPLRPDHVPQLVGEEDGPAGYTMLGRLFAFGYLRGILQALENEN